jgi:hypothetical protein
MGFCCVSASLATGMYLVTREEGCMDPNANNFSNTATSNLSNTCTYDYGCMDPNANNYSSTVTSNLASMCKYDTVNDTPTITSNSRPDIEGCMDPTAINYNEDATIAGWCNMVSSDWTEESELGFNTTGGLGTVEQLTEDLDEETTEQVVNQWNQGINDMNQTLINNDKFYTTKEGTSSDPGTWGWNAPCIQTTCFNEDETCPLDRNGNRMMKTICQPPTSLMCGQGGRKTSEENSVYSGNTEYVGCIPATAKNVNRANKALTWNMPNYMNARNLARDAFDMSYDRIGKPAGTQQICMMGMCQDVDMPTGPPNDIIPVNPDGTLIFTEEE